MGALVLTWLAGHKDLFIGMATGLVLSNPITCATIAFGMALKIPGFGPWVAKNPDQVKQWFDSFDKGIDAAVNKYATTQKTQPPTAPAP